MRKHAWWMPLVGALALGAGCLAVARALDDDEAAHMKAAQAAAPDVQKLAESVGDPAALKKEAEAVVKKYDELMPIMWQMKPAAKGGMLVGKPGTFMNDSIELGLIQLGKKSPSAKDLKDKAPDLTKMAEVTRGIAEVTPSYASKFAKDAAGVKAWNGLAEDMKKASDDVIAAAKSGDDKAFKKSVNDLNHSCNECHTQFRDN